MSTDVDGYRWIATGRLGRAREPGGGSEAVQNAVWSCLKKVLHAHKELPTSNDDTSRVLQQKIVMDSDG